MTDSTPLSPTAQAVDRAVADRIQLLGEIAPSRQIAAAALRAAADQVFPLERTPWGSRLIPILTSQESRDRLLAIAAELKNHQ